MKSADEAIKKLLSNKTSGSTEILSKLNKLISKHLGSTEFISFFIKEAKKQFQEFAALNEYSHRIESFIRSNDSKGVKFFVHNFEKSISEGIIQIYKKNFKILKKVNSVITLSNSRTTELIFTMMGEMNKSLMVYIAESRPKLEGRILAKALLKKGISVELFTDFSTGKVIKHCDAVIVGVDTILSNGNIIIKTGSVVLAVLAKENKVPFYAVAAKTKFSRRKKTALQTKACADVWNFTHPLLKVQNNYFEEVDNKYITKILTD